MGIRNKIIFKIKNLACKFSVMGWRYPEQSFVGFLYYVVKLNQQFSVPTIILWILDIIKFKEKGVQIIERGSHKRQPLPLCSFLLLLSFSFLRKLLYYAIVKSQVDEIFCIASNIKFAKYTKILHYIWLVRT